MRENFHHYGNTILQKKPFDHSPVFSFENMKYNGLIYAGYFIV